MKKIKLFFVFVLTLAIGSTVYAINFTDYNLVIDNPIQDKVEIAISDLPASISDLLSKDFDGYSVDKAFTSEKDGNTVYYVDLSKDGQVVTLLFDENGNVIEG